MISKTSPFAQLPTGTLLVTMGAVILALEPAQWLVRSWIDPSYGSDGWLFAGLVAALLYWSLSSPRIAREPRHLAVLGIALLALTAGLRLSGQVLAINKLGGLALAVDVTAIALIAGCSRRQRALSPLWLGALFVFALPIDRLVERTIGFPLQRVSADWACALVSLWRDDLVCEGVRLTAGGKTVLVDFPCSGATGLVLVLGLTVFRAAITRPSLTRALTGLGIALLACLLANALRVAVLSAGVIAGPDSFGVDVMSEPWHGAIGLLTLALAATAPLLWFRARPTMVALEPVSDRPARATVPPLAGLSFAILCALIISLPSHPIDTSGTVPEARLPAQIQGQRAIDQPLSPGEERYFRTYGGTAAKATYGASTLLLTRTRSPLRHLHAPEECLRGLGYKVEFVGTVDRPAHAAVYKVTDTDGRHWRAAVTFTSDRGHRLTSVGAAVWHWLQAPASTWTSVQRITPWDMPPARALAFDAASLAALDLSPTP